MLDKKPIFIAEIKTKSPFGLDSKIPFVTQMQYAIKYGDWISVHTNALWGGDFEAISFVRRNTDKPILAKGLHSTDDDIKRAVDHGATHVLVVDRYPLTIDKALYKFHKDKVLHEFSNAFELRDELGISPELRNFKYVANSRDLRTGLPFKRDSVGELLDLGVWTCQASGIKTLDDVRPNVDAFIVGEHMIEVCQELRKKRNET